VFFQTPMAGLKMENFCVGVSFIEESEYDRCRAMDLHREARPRHFIFNSLRRRDSSGDRAHESCTYSNLNTTSLATTS
jgi:hypothetical protein